jgi:hypothetical protein
MAPDLLGMLAWRPTWARGAFAAAALGLNTLCFATLLMPLALVKLLLRLRWVRRWGDRITNSLASVWGANNDAWIAALSSRASDVQVLVAAAG